MENYSFNYVSGRFSKEDARNIITGLVEVKIKHHEEKIRQSDNEEDIKMRENKIKSLQTHLTEVKKYIDSQKETVNLSGDLML